MYTKEFIKLESIKFFDINLVWIIEQKLPLKWLQLHFTLILYVYVFYYCYYSTSTKDDNRDNEYQCHFFKSK